MSGRQAPPPTSLVSVATRPPENTAETMVAATVAMSPALKPKATVRRVIDLKERADFTNKSERVANLGRQHREEGRYPRSRWTACVLSLVCPLCLQAKPLTLWERLRVEVDV
jgi:hypothetical protein